MRSPLRFGKKNGVELIRSSEVSSSRSGFYGVTQHHTPTGQFRTIIYDPTAKRQVGIGYYHTAIDAAIAHDKAQQYVGRGQGHKFNFAKTGV